MIRKYDEYVDQNGHFYHVYEISGDIITLKLVRRSSFDKARTIIVKRPELEKKYKKTKAGEVTVYKIERKTK